MEDAGFDARSRATLSHPSSAWTTVTVAAAPGAYTVGEDAAIVIAAGATANAADTVTVTAVDDATDAPDRTTRVTGSASNDQGVNAAVAGAPLLLVDDEAAPTVTLSVADASIREDGGATTVGATLSHPSSQWTTVTVAPVSGAYTVGADAAIVIAAGATANAADTVAVTAVNEAGRVADRRVTVGGTARNRQGAGTVTGAELTLVDAALAVTLRLSASSISEDGGVATVTAVLNGTSSEALTLTVGAAAGANAVAADFVLSTATTLTVAAGRTTSTGEVTVRAAGTANDDVHEPDRSVTVSATAAGGHGLAAPSNAALTITEDEALPTVTLVLTPSTIVEGGTGATTASTVTAELSGKSSEAVTVTVSAAAVSPAVAGDFTQSGTKLTIAAGATASTGTVTVTATDDTASEPHESVEVSGTASGGNGVAAPSAVTLTLEDDDAPTVALVLDPTSVSEAGGVSTVTATLNRMATEAATITVSVAAGAGAAAGDFTQSGTTLTVAAGQMTSAGEVTVTAVDDTPPRDQPDKSVAVSATVTGGDGAVDPSGVTLTITDADDPPTVSISSPSVAEGAMGSTAALSFAVTLDAVSGKQVTVDYAEGAGGTAAAGTDYTALAAGTLTFAAGETSRSVAVTVTGDGTDEADETVVVTLSGPVNATLAVAAGQTADTGTGTITDDDAAPTVSISSPSVAEGAVGSTAALSFAVTLDAVSGKQVTVDYAEGAGGTATAGTDYTALAAGTLTFAAGETSRSVDVTVAGDATDEADETVVVTLSGPVNAALAVAAGQTADTGTGTITDDDAAPEVSISSPSVAEGAMGSTAALSFAVTLDAVSGKQVTVDYAEGAGGTAAAGTDYTALAAGTLTFAAGETSRSVAVTVTGDGVDEADETVAVTLSGPVNAALSSTAATGTGTITDDDTAAAALVLTPVSISEAGGVSTVTATLSLVSSEAVTLTVGAAAGANAVAADFVLSTAATLTVAAGRTTSTGEVTVRAAGTANDDVHEPDRSVTVSATAAGGHGLAAPSNAALTIAEDEALPTVTLVLTPSTIAEGGTGATTASTVTAELSGKSSEAVTVTVSAAAVSPAVAGDFTQSGTKLTIAAGATASTGTVTVTATDDTASEPHESVEVSGTASGGNGVAAPSAVTLTLEDDDAPTVALVLDPTSVSEAGGVSTVTATLNRAATEATTITVSAAAGTGAAAGDFTQSGTTLTVAAGQMTSAGEVTVTAVDDTPPRDQPDKSVAVSATVTGGDGAVDPSGVTLTITDADDPPAVTLALSPAAVSENGGVSTVSAALSHPSSAATTVTVTAVSGFYTVGAGANATIVVAAGDTTSTDTATVTAVDNPTDEPDRMATVTATAANAQAAADSQTVSLTGATLTLTDDETLPTVALALSDTSISETGGVSTVTATLSGPSSEAVTVTVAAVAGASTGAVSGDFALSTATKLTIAAGSTTSAGEVTVTANGNAVDAPNKSVTVSGTAAGGNGVVDPPDATLTLEDDDALPTVALVLTPASISESGGISTVTATLSGPSSEAVTVTVAAAAVASTGAVSGDFSLSSTTTLTLAAGSTTSAGEVAVTANGNTVHSPNKSVTVSGTAAGGHGVSNPPNATLTLEDDETLPTVALALTPTSISETDGISTVTATLSGVSSEAVTVTVATTAVASTGAVSGDFALSTATKLTIAAGSTTSAGEVTVTANGNDVDAANKSVTVSGTAAGGNRVANPSNVTLTLTDDDTAGVSVSPATSTTNRLVTTESGGTATFTVALESEPTGNVELDVASSDTAEGTAAPAILTFTSSDWSTAQTVTVTGVDDSPPVADGNRNYTVTVTVDTANTADAKYDTLTALTVYANNRDNEYGLAVGGVTGQATEAAGGTSTFTVALRTQPSEAVTVSVTSRDEGEGLVSVGGGAPAASTTLTFAAAAWSTAQTVTVTGVQDPVDDGTVAWNVRLDPSSGDGNYEGLSDVDVSVSTTDDDGPPTVTLALNPSSIAESGSGNVATVTARLSHPSGAATTVTVTAVSGSYTVGTDATIVIAASATTNASDTATVSAVDNPKDEPDRTPTVTATITNDRAAADGATMTVTGATLTITDDDPAPTAALALNPSSVSENGGVSTVTATLSNPSSQPSTVTVTPVSGSYTVGTDATITIAAGSTTAASDTVLVTAVDDAIHQGSTGRNVTVTAALTNGQGAGAVTGAALTLTDEETLPTVALVLSSTSISETGGVSTVTATLSGPSSAAVTVTVAAAAGAGAVAADFALSTATTLTFAANATTSTGLVTVTANGNAVDSPNKSVTVSGTAAGGNGVVNPPNVTLTLEDDDALPTVALVLAPTSISETNGVSTVTATLSGPSSEAVTVTVGAAAVASTGAVSGDFALSTAKTLTIAAGSTTSSGAVTLTANGNAVDSPNKSVTVSGAAAGGNGVAAPSNATLTLEDDDALPTVALVLTPSSITETGGVSTVTATLSGASSEAVTVTVGAAAGTGAVAADFTLSTATTLTFAANATTSTGLVTVTANGNAVDSPNKSVTVSGAAVGGNGVADPPNVTLTLEDDDALPTVALVLAPSSITESGGISTVTATLSGPSSESVTVTVAAAAGTGAVSGDFTLSSTTTLTLAAGATTSAGTVTVTANGNTVDSPHKSVTVSGTASGGNSVANPPNVILALEDDETLPTVALALSASSISEEGGVSTVTATLSGPSSEAVTVTVGAAAGTGAVAADFTLSTAKTLTIAAGSTTSAGEVTVTANGNAVDSPDKSVTVSGTAAGGNGVAAPSNATLTLTDDDALPTAVLALSDTSITETGGVSTVTATLSGASSEAVTVTVAAAAGAGAAAADFTLSSAKTLTIAAGSTTSAGEVTVTANGNAVDSPDKSVTISGTAAGGNGVAAPSNATLTLEDDETVPTVALVLTPSSITETGGVSTVTASLSGASSESVTVTVAAAAGTGAVSGDFALSTATKLTIAAGSTTSVGAVTVTANGNTVHSPDKSVTVSGTSAGGNGVADPPDATLTLEDDETLPTVALILTPSSISETGGVSTVAATLSGVSSESVTVTVAAAAGTGAVGGDFALSAAKTLTIAAGSTTSAGEVTVTANGNAVDSPDKSVTVSGTVAGGNGVVNPPDVTLTLTDDDALPTVALALSDTSISETGGVSTVTATLSGASSAAVTVTVAAAAGAGAVAADFTLSSAKTLTIAAGSTTSAGEVTVTANGNAVDSPDKSVTISGTAAGGNGVANPPSATLTLEDDDARPTVALALSDTSITETNGVSTVTATLSGPSSAAVTVTVGAAAVASTGAVSGDFALSTAKTLTIAAGSTESAGLVTVTANGNAVDAPNKSVTVSGTATGGNGVANPPDATLTLEDDDALPTVALVLTPSSITETGGISTVTATLSGPSSESVAVTVAAAAGTGAVSGDFALSTAKTLTIAAGSTTSAGAVTVTANGNTVHSPDKSVTVSGTSAGGNGVANPSVATLTLEDDETLPTVALILTPTSITETNGVSTVAATLSGVSSEAVTVTVGAVAGTGAVAADFDLSTATTLTIAAGATTSAGAVTLTANGNAVDSPNKSVTVSGMSAGGNGVADPPNVTLTLTDDDALPTVALVLTPSTVGENGGISTVTATLSGKSSAAVTVTVSAAPVASTGAVSGDFALSTATTLTIAAGATASSGTVTVTAQDNSADEPDAQVRVSGTAAGGNGVTTPPAVILTIRDDEGPPTVTLVLTPSTIDESGTGSTAAVTATLNRTSSAATTVTVSAAPVTSTGAAAGDYTLSSANTLTIAAGATTSSGTVTVAAVDDDTDAPNKQVTVSGTAANAQGVQSPIARTLTIADDDAAPDAALALSASSVSENGGVSTVTATLSRRSAQATTVTVQAVTGAFTVGSGAASRIVVAAGATVSADEVALTAVDNDVDAADRQVTVTATLSNGHGAGTVTGGGVALTLTDDDTAGIAVSPATSTASRLVTTESGGTATFTVRLDSEPAGDVELDVASSDTDEGTVMPAILTFTSSTWSTAQTVTVTGVDDSPPAADGSRDYTVTVTVDTANTADSNYDALSALTVYAVNADNEYGLDVGSVSGQATEAGGTSTFTVALRTQPSEAVTVSVTSRDEGEGLVSAGGGAPAASTTLTFAAAAWNAAQTVTVTGVQDPVDDGTVTWNVRLDPASGDGNYDGLLDVDVSVSTTDDDGPPTVTLALDPASIAESGAGSTATVTARLSHPSGAATTVTVSAASGLYTAGADAAIVIAAGATQAASDTATVVAVDNPTDEPDRTGTVTATATNARAAADSTTMPVTGAALTVRDDEAAAGAVLSLNPGSVSENGGTSAVSATLSHPSSEATTVTVTAVSGAYTVGADNTITIAAGSTTAASDTATVTAVDDAVHQGSAGRRVTVTATLANGQGAGSVTGATLTLTDDETLPTASLALAPTSISENGGVSTVTVTLSGGPSSQPVTVTVSSSAVASTGAVAGDFTQTGTTLTIAAGATASTGTVTVRGNDNAVDAADKSVTVSGTAAGGHGVANPSAATLTLTDDEATATATLVLTPASILENGAVSTVTARLSHPTTEAVTLTVSAAPVSPAVAGDFTQGATTTLTIAAGGTTSTGLVTVTAEDNAVASGRKQVRVSATAAGGRMVAAPSAATLVIRDDEFGLDESAVTGQATEDGGTATFTVALQTQPSAAVTVSVTSRDEDGRPDESEGTVSPPSLVFTLQNWSTAQRVTVTGVDDDVDDGDVAWKVRLDPSSGDADYDGLDPVDVDVSTTDDDDAPTVTLKLDPKSISEAGEVSTVTAALSHPSSAETTVTVSVAPVSPAVEGDFSLSPADTLTIAAGGTTSTGLVTVTAVNNDVDADDKTVTVSGTAANSRAGGDGMDMTVTAATLTIADDDEKGLAFSSEALVVAAGSSTSWTVELTSEPTGDVTVTISSPDDATGLMVDPARLVFTARSWREAQTVTVAAAAGTPGDAGGAASALRHTGSGGGYGEVEKDLWVAGEEATEVGTSGDTGTMTERTYVMDGQPVTVMKAAGVPAGVTIEPRGSLTRPVTVTVTPLTDAEAAEAAGDGYSLGPAESRVALDVSVFPALAASARLCLPVNDGLRTRAAGRELSLLRGGEPVVGSEEERGPDGGAIRVCADVPSFSPFAVGYEDTAPEFTVASLTLTFTVGEEQSETLPAAEGGDGVTYRLTPEDPPPGLSMDLDTRVLSGTPTEAVTRRYTWTARDVDGPQQDATMTVDVEVVPAVAQARARLKAVNESVLPELSRASWDSAMAAVSRRLGSAGGGGGSGASGEGLSAALAGFMRSHERALEEGGASWKELWSGQSFAVALGGGGEGEGAGAGLGGPVTVWGAGERRSLSRDTPALAWSGELFAAHLGADVGLGSGLTGGAGVSWFESGMDYTDRSGEEGPVEGVHRSWMASVQPYLGWSSGSGARLWGALGYGAGEVEIVDEALVEDYGRQRSGSELRAVAAGGAVRLVSDGAAWVDLKGEGQATRYEVDENGDLIEGLSVRTQRLRLAMEGAREYALDDGARLAPSGELGVRWDGGDGATGTGVEVGGGLSWEGPGVGTGGGLVLEVGGRWLVAHRGDLEEWGVSGGVRLEPRGTGRGLSLSVEPSWGEAGSGTGRLWEEGVAGRGSSGGGRASGVERASGVGVEAELGYGLPAFGVGVGTPYTRFGQAPEGERRYGFGWRLDLPGEALGLDVEGWRRERDTDRPDHGVSLELRLSW